MQSLSAADCSASNSGQMWLSASVGLGAGSFPDCWCMRVSQCPARGRCIWSNACSQKVHNGCIYAVCLSLHITLYQTNAEETVLCHPRCSLLAGKVRQLDVATRHAGTSELPGEVGAGTYTHFPVSCLPVTNQPWLQHGTAHVQRSHVSVFLGKPTLHASSSQHNLSSTRVSPLCGRIPVVGLRSH